ncbi:RNA polymerase sigma factor [Streptantibioticus rubrisoli]|uniref:RNA polymerase sigma factor n=1 Tax=Streptantibioticus rubrisoli TaxID=1387313 RepID=A0ABT1PFV0_9ACTN|nr:sigma-70 family RNA polymerase sigma factor [Streptantibioticus rubrisoli]MCQ4043353.1 RNA polymerase sigma factor [Streptantibioticus rubrisoli]
MTTVREARKWDEAALTHAVHAAQDGDEEGFRRVYRALQPMLLRYVRTLVGGTDAEDVMSEAWLHITRDLHTFRGNGEGFRAWAAKVARNRALDHLRRSGRRPLIGGDESDLLELPSISDTAAEALEAVSTDRALALIASLPREQGEAVLLRVVLGLDAKHAGRVLGKRPGAVRVCAYRGVRRLAEMLRAGRTPQPVMGRAAMRKDTA